MALATEKQEGETGASVLGPEPTTSKTTFLRLGTWFWRVEDQDDRTRNISRVGDVLKEDPRVVRVRVVEQRASAMSRLRMFPDFPRTTAESIISGDDSFAALSATHLLTFEVRVPVKNQPLHHGDEAPSDTYWVSWDGIEAFVMWEQEGEDRPLSGGQVVATILSQALERLGDSLYVQNCSPGCEFQFVHVTVRVEHDPEAAGFFDVFLDEDNGPVMSIPFINEPLDDVEYIGIMLNGSIEKFAEFKNSGRRLIDLEDEVRESLSHVLVHLHEHALLAAGGWKPRVLWSRWNGRKWRREARHLISRAWLGMAHIETLRRQWDEQRVWLTSSEEDAMPLLREDIVRDVASVQALDLAPVAATVNQISNGLDNRTVVTATGWGALAGGVAGLTGSLVATLLQ